MEFKHGTGNEGQESKIGYSQAVSGLCDMTPEYDRMFTAEGRYWCKFKQANPNVWTKQLNRLKRTRGTLFVEKMLSCIKWLDKK